MRLRRLALGATLSVLSCSAAMAKIGVVQPTTSQRDLGFGAQVLVLYDSNSSRSGAAVARQRNLAASDVTVTPSLDFNLTQPVGQQSLYLNGSAGYQFHRKNKVLDRQNYVLDGGGSARLGVCQASAFGSYRASQADLMDLDPLTNKNLRSSKGLGTTLQCGLPTGLGFNMTVQRTENKNSEPRLKVSDSDTKNIAVGIGYQNAMLGTIGLSYSYDTNEFPNRMIPGRPIGDGYFSEAFGVTAQRNFGSKLSVDLAASRLKLKREFAPLGFPATLTGSNYAATVSYNLGTRISLGAGASRSIRPSGRPGKLYDIAESANLDIGYKLGSRFDVGLTQTYGRVTSNRDTLTPLLVITNSQLYSTSLNLTYSQSARFKLGINVRYDDRQTNLPQFDYSATSVGIRAGTSF